MLDELYDDVLSVMTEKGFTGWFDRNHQGRVSPLKWCYEREGELKLPPNPPSGLTWKINSYDMMYHPNELQIDEFGSVGPRNSD